MAQLVDGVCATYPYLVLWQQCRSAKSDAALLYVYDSQGTWYTADRNAYSTSAVQANGGALSSYIKGAVLELCTVQDHWTLDPDVLLGWQGCQQMLCVKSVIVEAAGARETLYSAVLCILLRQLTWCLAVACAEMHLAC